MFCNYGDHGAALALSQLYVKELQLFFYILVTCSSSRYSFHFNARGDSGVTLSSPMISLRPDTDGWMRRI